MGHNLTALIGPTAGHGSPDVGNGQPAFWGGHSLRHAPDVRCVPTKDPVGNRFHFGRAAPTKRDEEGERSVSEGDTCSESDDVSRRSPQAEKVKVIFDRVLS